MLNVSALSTKQHCLLTILVIFIIALPSCGHTAQFEIIPGLTISEEYNDNIDLNKASEEKSDFITIISPGLAISGKTRTNGLEASYSPSIVKYSDHTEYDTIRHNGSLYLWQKLAEHTTFEIRDSYIRSENTTEEFDTPEEGVRYRRSRKYMYDRNTAAANIDFQFGPNNHFIMGYDYIMLENEDPAIDDERSYGPFARITYAFNVKNSLELSYQYRRSDFRREQGIASESDFQNHDGVVRYRYRFTQLTSLVASYRYSQRDYETDPDDYYLHEGSIGIDHALTRRTNLSIETGYYRRYSKISPNEDGFRSNISIDHRFERGTLSFYGNTGWDVDHGADLDKRLYFTEYRSAGSRVSYMAAKDISFHAGASYRKNRYSSTIYEPDDETYQGNASIKYAFLRWFTLALDYTYLKRTSADPENEFEDNRVMLSISAAYPYRTAIKEFD